MDDFDVDAAVAWLQSQGPRYFGTKSAGQYWTAIRRFADERLPGEPRGAAWFIDHLDPLLLSRFREKSSVGPSSIRTYASRARAGISAYAEWLSDPVNWTPHRKKAGARTRPTPSPETPSPSPRLPQTLEEEVSEALQALSRWPRLRPHLIRGISAAVQQLAEESEQ